MAEVTIQGEREPAERYTPKQGELLVSKFSTTQGNALALYMRIVTPNGERLDVNLETGIAYKTGETITWGIPFNGEATIRNK